MVDQRIRTTLLCAAFAIAIAVSILLRSRKNKSHYLLSMFAGCMGLWYLTQFLWGSFEKEIVFFRLTATLSILLPVLSTVLFDALSPQPQDKSSPLRKLSPRWMRLPSPAGVSRPSSPA